MTASITTFYSFKGGVGRTQALANVALHLAHSGRHVVLVDMDLESPGLHFFFLSNTPNRGRDRDGVLEFLEECLKNPTAPPDVVRRLVTCTSPFPSNGAGSIRLLTAGNLDADYARRLARFSWEDFYEKHDGYRYIEYLRDQLVGSGADFVLVDSRTGATDVGTVCTFQLPETVMVFFALHEQGLFGAEQVAFAIKTRGGGRARRVVIVPSRVDEAGEDGLRGKWMKQAHALLADVADDFLGEPGQRIPHMSRASFGEYLLDPHDVKDSSNLRSAYANLSQIIVRDAVNMLLSTRDVSLGEFRQWSGEGDLQSRIELMLEDQLEKRSRALSDRARPPPTDRTLFNLLRIALQIDEEPRPLYWSAYELALGDVDGGTLDDLTLFEQVGATLWNRVWRAALRRVLEGLPGEELIAGAAAHAQLERLTAPERDAPDAFKAGVRILAPALAEAWGAGSAERVHALFRRYPEQHYVVHAVVSAGHPDLDVARALSAALLDAQYATGVRPPPLLVKRFATLLAERDRVVEAFYFICREGDRTPALVADEFFSALAAAFVLRARRNKRLEPVDELLAHTAFTATLARSPVGALWLAWVAVGFDTTSWSESTRATMRRALHETPNLGSNIPEPIQNLLHDHRGNRGIALRDALRWFELTQALNRAIETVKVHNTRGPRSHYEATFKTFWRPRMKPYVEPSSRRDAPHLDLDRVDVEDVIRAARAGRADMPAPVDAAFNNLNDQFDRVRSIARELVSLVDSLPEASRPHLPARRNEAEVARRAFEEWATKVDESCADGWKTKDLRAVVSS